MLKECIFKVWENWKPLKVEIHYYGSLLVSPHKNMKTKINP